MTSLSTFAPFNENEWKTFLSMSPRGKEMTAIALIGIKPRIMTLTSPTDLFTRVLGQKELVSWRIDAGQSYWILGDVEYNGKKYLHILSRNWRFFYFPHPEVS